MGLPTILGQLFLIASLAFLLTYKWSSVFSSEINTAFSSVPGAASVHVDTLVIYIFSPTDPEYERNMRFFIEHGMSANDPCHYAIIVQQTGRDLQQELPVLPLNAWYASSDPSWPLFMLTCIHAVTVQCEHISVATHTSKLLRADACTYIRLHSALCRPKEASSQH